MTDCLLSCTGAEVGRLVLRPFELRSRSALCLQIPRNDDKELLISVLTGQIPRPEFRMAGRVVWAAAPIPPRGPFPYLRSPRAFDWLAKRCRIPRARAEAIITEARLFSPKDRICALAGTPRAALGVLAAIESGADAIIYSTSGLDPNGAKMVHDLVLKNLDTCSALHLAFEHVSKGRLDFDQPAGATVVRVGRLPPHESAILAR